MSNTLFIPDYHEVFDSEISLRTALEEKDQNTIVCPLEEPADVLLTEDGRTLSGDKLSRTALFQVCSALSPGLFSVVESLSGIAPAEDIPPSGYSVKDAINIYNIAVNRRFNVVLRGQRKTLKELREGIDPPVLVGLMGGRYRTVPNMAFFDQAIAAMESMDADLSFFSASIGGRRFLLSYVSKDPFCSLSSDDALHRGVYFINSEIAGEAGIRGGLIIYRKKYGTLYRKEVIPRRRIQHVGKRVYQRIKLLLSRISQLYETLPEHIGCPPRATDIWLGFEGDEQQREQRINELVALLQQNKVPTKLARDSVLLAIHEGSSAVDGSLNTPIGRKTLSERSVFDLAHALSIVARDCIAEKRYQLETVAFRFLTTFGGKR